MITARLLNQDATLNNYKQIGGIPFVNGDTIRIVIQFFNEELATRHLIGTTGTQVIQLGVNFSDGTITTANNIALTNLTALDGATDRSIWFADVVTNNVGGSGKTLVGGNITFSFSNDANSIGDITSGIIFNALQRVIVT